MSDAQDTEASTAPAALAGDDTAAPAPIEPLSTAFIPPPPPPPPLITTPPPAEPAPKEATPDLVLEHGSGDDPFVPNDGGDVPPAPDQGPPPISALIDPPYPPPDDPAPFVPSPQPPVIALGQVQVQATIALAEDPLIKLQAFLAANPDVVTYIAEHEPPPATPS